MPVTLKPLEQVQGDVLLVGDPRRAFALAQEVTVQPRLSHLARGLWGYSGETTAGRPLTVQSTGTGAPSAAAVIHDLAAMGATRMVRLGTCVSGTQAPGQVLLVEAAQGRDGTSRALTGADASGTDGREITAVPDRPLTDSLRGLGSPGRVVSHDLVVRLDRGSSPARTAARDLQTAATFIVAGQAGIPVAALLVVAGDGRGSHLEESELESVFRPLSRAVVSRLEAGD